MSTVGAISCEEVIRKVTYYYWEKRGRPLGTPEEDWFRAECDLRAPQIAQFPFGNLTYMKVTS